MKYELGANCECVRSGGQGQDSEHKSFRFAAISFYLLLH